MRRVGEEEEEEEEEQTCRGQGKEQQGEEGRGGRAKQRGEDNKGTNVTVDMRSVVLFSLHLEKQQINPTF